MTRFVGTRWSRRWWARRIRRGRRGCGLLVDVFLESHGRPPARIVLDVDVTDDPLHGQQEGRFFHGYYRHYCYLPLYIFCGGHLLCARLRPSNIDAAAGVADELARVVAQVRQTWPGVEIVVRGDSSFCREELLSWCEAHRVDYVIGIAKNERLKAQLAASQDEARAQFAASGQPARIFADLRYRTLKSWSRERRVVGKAEHLPAGPNPRFVVTSLPLETLDARTLYETLLLRPRRHGKPHQGTATGPLRRPHEFGDVPGQPVALVLGDAGLRAPAHPTRTCSSRPRNSCGRLPQRADTTSPERKKSHTRSEARGRGRAPTPPPEHHPERVSRASSARNRHSRQPHPSMPPPKSPFLRGCEKSGLGV